MGHGKFSILFQLGTIPPSNYRISEGAKFLFGTFCTTYGYREVFYMSFEHFLCSSSHLSNYNTIVFFSFLFQFHIPSANASEWKLLVLLPYPSLFSFNDTKI